MSLYATLHAPHLPVAGAPCQVYFAGDSFIITDPELLTVPADALKVSVGGFHDDALFLNWPQNGVEYSVVVTGEALRALLATAPASVLPKLKRGQATLKYHRSKWRAVLIMLGVLTLGVLTAWWWSDALTGWIARQVPVRKEARLGEAMLAQLKQAEKLTQIGAAATVVKDIGNKLTKGSRYQYQWYVADDPKVNAFAIPGGIVIVNAGLIAKTNSAEELAGVLAHEIQHVELRHTLQQMIHSAGWAAVLTVTLGDVSALTGIFIHQLGSLRHSRRLENEADAEGLKTMVHASISPLGLTRFLKNLQAEEIRNGEQVNIELLSTHPATRDRLIRIDQLARSTPCQCPPLNYDWAAVQASAKTISSGTSLTLAQHPAHTAH